MTHPLKPKTKLERRLNADGTCIYELYQFGYTQRAPFNVFSPVTRREAFSSGLRDAISLDHTSGNVPADLITEVENKAYERMMGKIGDGSSFGATLTAERKETWGMVVNTLTRVLLAAKQVKSGNLSGAARTLNIPFSEKVVTKRVRRAHLSSDTRIRYRTLRKRYIVLPNGRAVQKTAANAWLFWSYGVKPLAQDIYNGMDVLQRPLPESTLRSSAKGSRSLTYRSGKSTEVLSYVYSVAWSIKVRVENPNLFLLNKLGLINPAQWILEGIRLSFVIDWFSNLSSVVGSFTDLAGLEIAEPCLTRVFRHHEAYSNYDWVPSASGTRNGVSFTRQAGSLSPKLRFAYEAFSWQRGLNAISLLIGVLPRKGSL